MALDVYHVWWDPALEAQIARAGSKRLSAFHICDWLVPTTDLLEDRGMMGDGVIDIPRMRSLVEAQGYRGCHEVEIFSARQLVEAPARGGPPRLPRAPRKRLLTLRYPADG